jgi:hypothetical protein
VEKELEQFGAIPHVGGVFVCDNTGEVILSSSPAVLATVTMNAIGREVARVLLALESAGRAVSRLDLKFNCWRLLAHDLNDAMLFVVCEAEVDMSVLRMTTDVVVATWESDARARKRLAAYRKERKQLIAATTVEPGLRSAWTPIQSH